MQDSKRNVDKDMPKTTARIEDYDVLATIGTGSYGTCKKIRRKADKKVKVHASVKKNYP